MTARQELDSFLDRYTPEVAQKARAAFTWMRRKFPGALVLVYDNYNALAIGFASSEKTSDAVFSIAAYPRWVTLFFLRGADLPDPHKRLTGAGKVVRHIVLEPVALLDDPQVRALIDAEAARWEFAPKGRGAIVIKSISKLQRPRRPGTLK